MSPAWMMDLSGRVSIIMRNMLVFAGACTVIVAGTGFAQAVKSHWKQCWQWSQWNWACSEVSANLTSWQWKWWKSIEFNPHLMQVIEQSWYPVPVAIRTIAICLATVGKCHALNTLKKENLIGLTSFPCQSKIPYNYYCEIWDTYRKLETLLTPAASN